MESHSETSALHNLIPLLQIISVSGTRNYSHSEGKLRFYTKQMKFGLPADGGRRGPHCKQTDASYLDMRLILNSIFVVLKQAR